MADTVEKINIVDLEINQDEALKSLSDIHGGISDVKEETSDLVKQNKKLEEQGKKNSIQYQNNATQIEKNKVQVKSLSKEYSTQQKVVNDVLQTSQRELGTLEKLTLKNKELRQELRELNLETEEGTKRQKEIVTEIDANTDVIKENSDSLVQSKMNVGNYTQSIEDSIPAFKNMLTGLKQVTAASKAFLATPLGLILAAAAAGIALLVKGFQKSQKLADEMKVANTGLKASFDVIIDRVSNGMEKAFQRLREDPLQAVKDLGKAIVTNLVNRVKALPQIFIKAFEAVKFAIKGNADEAKKSLSELKDAFIQLETGLDPAQREKIAESFRSVRIEMEKEAEAARELARAEIALSDLEIELIGITAQLTKRREEAKLATRDETLSIEERLAAQDRAIAIDKELLGVEIDAAKERARISQERVDLGKSSRAELEENAQLQAEVINLESQFFTRSKELFSERISLNNQLRAAEQARTDAAAQGLLEEAQDLQEFVDREIEIWALRNESAIEKGQELTDSLIEEEGERLDLLEEQRIAAADLSFQNELTSLQEHELALLQIKQDTADAKAAIDLTYEAQRTKIEEQAVKLRIATAKMEKNLKIQFAQGFFGTIAGLASEHTVAHKAATTALMAIDTYKGALAAYASFQSLPAPSGPILGGIAAAGVTALGLNSIRKVWAVDPKGGATSVSAPGGGGSVTASIPEASITSAGGLVERDVGNQANVPDTIIEKQPILVTDQVTFDQTNTEEIEILSSV